ncbi:MAG TPA: hypothetical protein VE291_04855 [Terracidiphilus sp.]|jgi:hypothetical protein|nr:hypothetical protein [Terracidiphilus sp.]
MSVTLASTYLPALHAAFPALRRLGMVGLTVTLFLSARDCRRKRCARSEFVRWCKV